MSGWLLAVALGTAVNVGYVLRRIRPARRLFEWAETQSEGDGWGHWVRRVPAAAIISTALALHPRATRRAYLDNRQRRRQQADPEFTGAMRPAYDPDWHREANHGDG
ncbi:hypothetical protein [Streptacidiphilus cavernicola]|uniref:DUF4235 domain-containing protein n=1 Tax=Streptacidiphilus cavernicola TaxID=3342716 RepID=A0ABV6W4D2_9ACTN